MTTNPHRGASALRIETLTGPALAPYIADLARLRTVVFRDFPYLYDGDAGDGAGYLRRYQETPGAAVILARDGARVVGAATCLPLAEETDSITAPLRARGLDLRRFFYFGESVLLSEYRGRGVGVAFFAAREAHVRRVSGADFATFCAVIRPPDHPARPAGYVPLDDFWKKRGYVARSDLVCALRWRDLGEAGEGEKRLGFWMKSLRAAALP